MENQGNGSFKQEITAEHKRLLYLIAEYTDYGKYLIKALPLKGIIFKGIIDNVFDYDYAPLSIVYINNTRRIMNVSQEGEDDLTDLREMDFLDKIRLATKEHFFIYAYKVTKKGAKFLETITNGDKEVTDLLIKCKCGNKFEILVLDNSIFLNCDKDNVTLDTGIMEIEDVAYESKSHVIRTPLTKKDKRRLGFY